MDENTEDPPRYVRRVDAMAQLGISEATIDRWRLAGRLTAVPKSELDRPGVWFYGDEVRALVTGASA